MAWPTAACPWTAPAHPGRRVPPAPLLLRGVRLRAPRCLDGAARIPSASTPGVLKPSRTLCAAWESGKSPCRYARVCSNETVSFGLGVTREACGGRPPRIGGLAGLGHRQPFPREGPPQGDAEHSHPRRGGTSPVMRSLPEGKLRRRILKHVQRL